MTPGMILSNEPGYYKPGEYGIRIENLVLVVDAKVEGSEGKYLTFETLTHVPLDRRLVDGTWPGSLRMSDKSRLGHGLIWRLCPPDIPMYGRKLTVDEIQARIQGYYRPYHRALRYAMERMLDRFGQVYHLNCHSMPAVSAPLMVMPNGARRRADFVLGDRDGVTANPEFVALTTQRLNDERRAA